MLSEREGRLLSTMINVLIAGLSDPQRLSRGRTYARQGAVVDVHLEAGRLTGAVQGSRARPYEVTIRVDDADAFDTLAALVPSRDEIDFSCTCPDWDDPCKHAVAVMVTFAEQIGQDPSLLGRWRGEPVGVAGGKRAVVGSRASSGAHGAVRESVVDALDDNARAALAVFLGEPVEYPLAPVSSVRPPVAAWGELWAEMLKDALDVLTEGTTVSER